MNSYEDSSSLDNTTKETFLRNLGQDIPLLPSDLRIKSELTWQPKPSLSGLITPLLIFP